MGTDNVIYVKKYDAQDMEKFPVHEREIWRYSGYMGLDKNPDEELKKYERISPTKALLSHAYGAERIESLCDGFCREIEQELSEEQLYCSNRFSPGYGDLPLETQVEFFRLMDCNRQIGISLNDSLLMTPSKSVTAIFGIGKCGWNRQEHKCSECSNTECEFRR